MCDILFFLLRLRRPPSATRTDTLYPYTTLFRSLADLVANLQAQGHLDAGLLLRALAGGDLDFVEHALARMARIPLANAQRLIHDPGKLGLAALWQRCRLPDSHQIGRAHV